VKKREEDDVKKVVVLARSSQSGTVSAVSCAAENNFCLGEKSSRQPLHRKSKGQLLPQWRRKSSQRSARVSILNELYSSLTYNILTKQKQQLPCEESQAS
jgi:hypothetical protein